MLNNIFYKKHTIILLIVFFIKNIPSYSQENNLMFEKMNLEFNIPQGYQISDTDMNTNWCSQNILDSPISKTLINDDKSILIGIALNPPIPEAMVELIKKTNPNWTPELNFLGVVKSLIDSSVDASKVLFYDPSYLNIIFNADKGFKFSQKCDGVYVGKYSHNKVVLIEKKDGGYFKIVFLYTDALNLLIDQEIDSILLKMIKFKK